MTVNGVHIGPLQQAPSTIPVAVGGDHARADHHPLSVPLSRWRRLSATLPLQVAVLATAMVWVLGCVWSFREQTLFASAKGFHIPWLLPAVIDGLAIALACVAYAASLDGRSGLLARMGTALAVAASAASNAAFAWQRSGDDSTMVIAAAVPVAANLAFEVLLHELRRQVLRRRGAPAPAALPRPRLIRVVLAPGSTLRQWRRLVLDLTSLAPANAATRGCSGAAARASGQAPERVRASAPTPGDDAPDDRAPGAPTACTAGATTPARRRADDPHTTALSSAPVLEGSRRDSAAAEIGVSGNGHAAERQRPAIASDSDSRHRPAATDLAELARQRYRASLAAGRPLTGRQLGLLHDRSPSWGRQRISEAKTHHRPDARSDRPAQWDTTPNGADVIGSRARRRRDPQ